MPSNVAAVFALLQLRVSFGCCSYPWLAPRGDDTPPRRADVHVERLLFGLHQIAALDLQVGSHESIQRSNSPAPTPVFRPLIPGEAALGSSVFDEAGAWFVFDARDGETYQLETESGTLKDTVMGLLDRDGRTTLVENDDDTRKSGILASYIEWTCPVTLSGTYYVNVRGYASTRGEFSVMVSVASRQSNENGLRPRLGDLVEPTDALYWETARADTVKMKQQGQRTWQLVLGLLGQAATPTTSSPASGVATSTELPQEEQELFSKQIADNNFGATARPTQKFVGLVALFAGSGAIFCCVASYLQRRQLRATPPDHLLCPITRDLFVDPVILVETGQTYERSMIARWLYTNKTDPISNMELKTKKLVPNIALRHSVAEWESGQCKSETFKPYLAVPALQASSSLKRAGARLKT